MPRSGGRRDEAGFVGVDDGLDAVAQAELLQDLGHVGLGGRLADHQLAADLRVGQAADEQVEHLALARGQLADGRRDGGLGAPPGRAATAPPPGRRWHSRNSSGWPARSGDSRPTLAGGGPAAPGGRGYPYSRVAVTLDPGVGPWLPRTCLASMLSSR